MVNKGSEELSLSGRNVLVTGGAGFLGSHICEKLILEGCEVRIIDTLASGREKNIFSIKDKVQLIKGELTDRRLLAEAIAGVDVVIHTAFPMEIREQKYSMAHLHIVTSGFFNLLEACLAENTLLIVISSIAVYGNPQYTPVDEKHPLEPETIYGAIKIAEEFYCRMMAKSHGLRTVMLRTSDIYGPRNTRVSVPINFLLKAMKNSPITVYGDGTQSRTYTYVNDFVDGVILAMKNCERALGKAINIASGRCVTMMELAQTVTKVIGQGSLFIDQTKKTDSRILEIDISSAKELLGFNPKVLLADGLKQTLDWIRGNQNYYPAH